MPEQMPLEEQLRQRYEMVYRQIEAGFEPLHIITGMVGAGYPLQTARDIVNAAVARIKPKLRRRFLAQCASGILVLIVGGIGILLRAHLSFSLYGLSWALAVAGAVWFGFGAVGYWRNR